MSRNKDISFIQLAANLREMLEDTVTLVQNRESVKRGTLAPVRARATQQVTNRAQSPSLDILNSYEQTSIRALLAWAANEQKMPQETVAAVTEVRFGVDDVMQLPRRDYEDVIKFLIDLRIDEMKN